MEKCDPVDHCRRANRLQVDLEDRGGFLYCGDPVMAELCHQPLCGNDTMSPSSHIPPEKSGNALYRLRHNQSSQ